MLGQLFQLYLSVAKLTDHFWNFHACVKNMIILNIYILYRSSSIWILYWPRVEIMQPEFI